MYASWHKFKLWVIILHRVLEKKESALSMCFHCTDTSNFSKRIKVQSSLLRHKLSLFNMQSWWQNWYLSKNIRGLRASTRGEWRKWEWQSKQTDNQFTDTHPTNPTILKFGFYRENNYQVFIFSIFHRHE